LLLTGIPLLRQKVAVVVAEVVGVIGTTKQGGIQLFTYPTHQLTPYQRGKSTSSKEHDVDFGETFYFPFSDATHHPILSMHMYSQAHAILFLLVSYTLQSYHEIL
jgi:hypothetical protein